METPDPPNDTPGALKHVVLTPHDIPWSLRAMLFLVASCDHHNPQTRGYLSEGPTLAWSLNGAVLTSFNLLYTKSLLLVLQRNQHSLPFFFESHVKHIRFPLWIKRCVGETAPATGDDMKDYSRWLNWKHMQFSSESNTAIFRSTAWFWSFCPEVGDSKFKVMFAFHSLCCELQAIKKCCQRMLNGLPSKKLTYPLRLALLSWFAFSQGRIC